LLELDDSRAGEVYRTSLEETKTRRKTSLATNDRDYYLPALLEGRIPEAPGIRGEVAGRLRAWLATKPEMGPKLQADFRAQLEAINARDALEAGGVVKRRFKLPEDADTDRDVLARARKEQDKLRDFLLDGRTKAQCDLCGRMLPAKLVVAAHIVPRHDLDHDQRVQFDRIAMIACQLGCDRLFELGYLTVDGEGIVEARFADGDLLPSVEGVAGRRCTAHNGLTAGAFAAHRAAWIEARN
jgi:hypothetical protein